MAICSKYSFLHNNKSKNEELGCVLFILATKILNLYLKIAFGVKLFIGAVKPIIKITAPVLYRFIFYFLNY